MVYYPPFHYGLRFPRTFFLLRQSWQLLVDSLIPRRLFQQGDVKDQVDLGPLRQLQPVGYLAYSGCDRKWPKVFRAKFRYLPLSNGLHVWVSQSQINSFPYFKFPITSPFICVLFYSVLGVCQLLFQLLQYLSSLLQVLFHSCGCGLTSCGWQGRGLYPYTTSNGVILVKAWQLELYPPLCHGQPPMPTLGLPHAHASQIGF